MEECERRLGHTEVRDKVDKLCDHIDKYIDEDRNFHNRVEQMFIDHFGDLDPGEHKDHHLWTRTRITEEKARADYLAKIKYEVIKNGILVSLGAVAMYVLVSVYTTIAVDIASAAQKPAHTQSQPK